MILFGIGGYILAAIFMFLLIDEMCKKGGDYDK